MGNQSRRTGAPSSAGNETLGVGAALGLTEGSQRTEQEVIEAGTTTGLLPPLPVEEIGANAQTDSEDEDESTLTAAIQGEVSPTDDKNDPTADATLEGADTPQIEDEDSANTGTDDYARRDDEPVGGAPLASDDKEPETSGPRTHTTKQGETFGDVVERFGVDHITLSKLNPDVNPHCVLTGTKLKLKA